VSAGALPLAIEADRVGKSFGRTVVLRDVTMRIPRGAAVAVFGPNGAGKSTLLRVCATLYRPSSGLLRLFDGAAAGPAVRRRIGLVAHQSFLYPDLSARENLVFYGRMYRLSDPERVADDWLARLALADAATRPLRVLSRGTEQRLALARALLHDPELVLLDEPWSGLDPAAADTLSALLADLKGAGRTVVIATHDFARGMEIGDRAIILHRGRVVWETADPTLARDDIDAIYRRVTGRVAA
jgi:heme exporter protein A